MVGLAGTVAAEPGVMNLSDDLTTSGDSAQYRSPTRPRWDPSIAAGSTSTSRVGPREDGSNGRRRWERPATGEGWGFENLSAHRELQLPILPATWPRSSSSSGAFVLETPPGTWMTREDPHS